MYEKIPVRNGDNVIGVASFDPATGILEATLTSPELDEYLSYVESIKEVSISFSGMVKQNADPTIPIEHVEPS
jgi:hypothetical protein